MTNFPKCNPSNCNTARRLRIYYREQCLAILKANNKHPDLCMKGENQIIQQNTPITMKRKGEIQNERNE